MERRSPSLVLAICLFLMPNLFSGCQSYRDHTTNRPPPSKQKQNFGDGGFLSGEPCGPPCFLNIISGVTKEEQAIEILQEYFNIQDCHRWDRRNEGGVRGIGCPRVIGDGLYTIGMDFDDRNIVDGLGFVPAQIITVEDVIAKYGNPDGVDVISWTEEDGFPKKIFMALYYDKIRTRLILPMQENSTYIVLPSTQIESISYPGSSHWEILREDNLSWQGFGEYEVR